MPPNGATSARSGDSVAQCSPGMERKRKRAKPAPIDVKAAPQGGFVESRASRFHDDLNLAVLLIMSVTAGIAMFVHSHTVQYGLTVFAVLYMVLDGIWICFNRTAVKSPNTVIGHHIATLVCLSDPLLQPQHAFYSACALIVEFNTLLLIVRRRVEWGRLIEIPFAVTWVGLRLIWYPFLGFHMTMCAFPSWGLEVFPKVLVDWRFRVEEGHPVPMMLPSYVAWMGICCFQCWWSLALFRSYKKKYDGSGSTPACTPDSASASKKYL